MEKRPLNGCSVLWTLVVVVATAGDDDSPRLRASTFTQVVVVRLGDTAQFDCQYDSAVSTDWYRDQRRLIADDKSVNASSRATVWLVDWRTSQSDVDVAHLFFTQPNPAHGPTRLTHLTARQIGASVLHSGVTQYVIYCVW